MKLIIKKSFNARKWNNKGYDIGFASVQTGHYSAKITENGFLGILKDDKGYVYIPLDLFKTKLAANEIEID